MLRGVMEENSVVADNVAIEKSEIL